MMHNNGFVASVKSADGKVLRESNGKVYLKVGSEYSLLLKNNNDRRAVAFVTIDGMDALGGSSIVIDANGSTTLERFCIDGNLSSGKKFLFVESTDSRVQDPTNKENGGIVIKFQLEKKPVIFASLCSTDYLGLGEVYSKGIRGATVEGSVSAQKFKTINDIELDYATTTIRLQLVPFQETITVDSVKYCSNCGLKCNMKDNFCSKCGNRL